MIWEDITHKEKFKQLSVRSEKVSHEFFQGHGFREKELQVQELQCLCIHPTGSRPVPCGPERARGSMAGEEGER